MHTIIVAEAGVNHNGNISVAKELIDVAASSGADYVKFQSFKAENVVQKTASAAKYQTVNIGKLVSQFEMLKQLELSEIDFLTLIKHSNLRNIGFMSTAFDIESANFLLSQGQEIFKIPSGEITNLPFLRQIGHLRKKIFLSTGMSSMQEVELALEVLEDAGTLRNQITVLHCTSAYPAPVADVNLLAMQTMKQTLDVAVGYSDHTLGIEVAVAAVALGATVIEKHFTLAKNLPGPDHKASVTPDELNLMVKQIRNVEKAIGDGVKRAVSSEKENLDVVRRSIVSKLPISKGELFTEINLTTKRPGTGISPMEWDRVIGRVAHRNFAADELIDDA